MNILYWLGYHDCGDYDHCKYWYTILLIMAVDKQISPLFPINWLHSNDGRLYCSITINQSIDQSTNQPTKQSINQSTNQWTVLPITDGYLMIWVIHGSSTYQDYISIISTWEILEVSLEFSQSLPILIDDNLIHSEIILIYW